MPAFHNGDHAANPENLQDNVPSRQRWDDPHWLVENYVAGRTFAEESADTIFVTWLIILDPDTDPIVAARSLSMRLNVGDGTARNGDRVRLLRLLSAFAWRGPARSKSQSLTS